MKEKTSYGRMKITTIGGFAMPGKKGMKHYPTAIKEEAVRMRLEEGLTVKAIMGTLGIIDERRIEKWCKAYCLQGTTGLQQFKAKGRPRKRERTAQEQVEYEFQQLKMENELLRNFLYEVGRR